MPTVLYYCGTVTQRSKFQLAALASAAMPDITVSGVREASQPSPTDVANGIDQAIVQDAAGKLYDVYVSTTDAGRKRLAGRVRAARTLTAAREPGGLGFSMDDVLAFEDGTNGKGRAGDTSVMVSAHHNGMPRSLNYLTVDDCSAIGTAIGAVHRLRPTFLTEAGYPAFTTEQIRAQLIAWIERLSNAGHIPAEITSSWSRILETDGLWSFSTCFVHGGFDDGDILFSGSTITAITNWQDMQVNDPARDLAWIYSKLDDTHRNAVLSAYGRMLGSRLDSLIMLRANLWLQMEQVGDFIQALSRADNAKIIQFKAQVERLAHQLGVAEQKATRSHTVAQSQQKTRKPPSTITVNTLLHDAEYRRSQAETVADLPDDTNESDLTGETDRTDSHETAINNSAGDSTADRPVMDTNHRPHSSSLTMALSRPSDAVNPPRPADNTAQNTAVHDAHSPLNETSDDTGEADVTAANSDNADNGSSGESIATVVIPLYEREEQAQRDAQSGLHVDAVDGADSTASGTIRTIPVRIDSASINAASSGLDSDVPDDTLDPDDTGESMPKA